MKQKNIEIANPKMGMTRSRSHYLLDENTYLFMLNGQSVDESGNKLSVSNEHSNILASLFKEGYKVLNHNNDIVTNTTYFFLTNPITGVSEIGKIYNKKSFDYPNDKDKINNCKDCVKELDLSTPLEKQEQKEHQVYETILTDDCNKCLNFDVNQPIVSLIKRENIGSIIAFAQKGNVPRYIELDNIEQYKSIDPDDCIEGDEISTCLDCEKLRIFKLYEPPCLESFDRILGGDLKKGVYETFIAYTDETGEELTSYTPLHSPISIFDESNIKYETEEQLTRTNFAIQYNLAKLDKKFTHYKIAVIYNVSQTITQTAKTSYELGIYSTSNNSFTLTDNLGQGVTTLNKILIPKPSIDSWTSLGSSAGVLFGTGVKYTEEINLQPVINLLGSAVKWRATIAKEDLYSKPTGNQYKGYNRDEVHAFGFQPITSDGYQYPIYPLIPRTIKDEEDELIVENNDVLSLVNIVDSCSNDTRNKVWQFYNTATREGNCSSEVETISLPQQLEAVTQTELPLLPSGSITNLIIPEDYEYVNFTEFLNTYKNDLCITPENSFISLCSLLDINNYDTFSTLPEEIENAVCNGFSEINKTLNILDVVNEETLFTYTPKEELALIKKPINTQIFLREGSTGEVAFDYDFSYTYHSNYVGYAVSLSFSRYDNFPNVSFATSQSLQKVSNSNISTFSGAGYFHRNLGRHSLAEMQTNIVMPTSVQVGNVNDGIYTDKLHKGALWFNTQIDGREEFYINLSRSGACEKGIRKFRNFKVSYYSSLETLRVSIFDSNISTTPLHSEIINTDDDNLILIDSSVINNSSSNILYISVETAIIETVGYGSNWDSIIEDPENGDVVPADTEPTVTSFILKSVCGSWNIADRSKEIKSIDITYDNIKVSKTQNWTNDCVFQIPKINDCKPVAFMDGELGYFESVEKYPCNKELYDSSQLEISPSDIDDIEYRLEFERSYIEGIVEGKYNLNAESNFQNKYIRHYRMPDNKISPFLGNNGTIEGLDTAIYPLGIHLDNNIINNFLDIAVKNNLITLEKRSKIIGYKIYRGDTTLERSVITSGLMFDMKRAMRNDKEYLFSNFPYNAQGEDKLYNDIAETTRENYVFSFNSPESDYFKVNIPSEISIQGYQQGVSKGFFDEVRDHQKMTILGGKARRLATKLALLETTAEVLIGLTQGAEVYRFQGGFAFSGNPIGIGFHVAALILNGIQAVVFNVGKYRYEWLKIFRDLGRPENFGYYYSSVADLSSLNTSNITEGERLRGITIGKHMKPALLTTVDKGITEAERFVINNIDREESVLLSTSKDYKLTHPLSHYNYDNNSTNPYYSSQPIASEQNCLSGLSDEFNRRVSIPYVALKNYVADQYKTIGSIDWIDTHYKGDLTQNNECDFVLGGDTFITRHSIKRKHKIFKTDGFGSADLTPINYDILSNVAKAKYYIDYEATKDESIGGSLFPDIDYVIETDCSTSSNDFYLKTPSKFYLYYYGQPNFLCESRVNTNYRSSNINPWEEFYPANQDFMEYTQEKVVSIKRQSSYFYNGMYSYNGTSYNNYTLPETFSKEVSLRQSDNPNNVMYSKQDVNGNSITEPWLVYRPNDTYVFPSDMGKLQALKGIESDQILAVLENTSAIYNPIDTFVNGLTENNQDLGTGTLFSRRTRTFSDTDLGYIGSQSRYIMSTEFGHYIVDAKRGQVFNISPGGQGFEEISRYSNKRPNGMDIWFKEHLPFKITRDFPTFTNLDNPYNGVGINMGWDSKYRRLFLTKKDYRLQPNKDLINCGSDFYNSNIEDYTDVISQYESESYKFEGIENCSLKFTKETLPNSTDIFAFFDTTSMSLVDAVSASNALKLWFTDYQNNNPAYEGSLYILPFGNEQWVNFPNVLKSGAIFLTTHSGWSDITIAPPNLNTSEWISPTELVVLAFVDESNDKYHGGSPTVGGFSSSGIVQPTTPYTNDFNNFVSNYNESFDFFKGVIYPIVKNTSGSTAALVLQALAAVEGTILTPAEIEATGTTVDVSILETENPYSNLGGLKNYGWKGVYDKLSPASDVFNSTTFGEELNNLIFIETEKDDLYISLTKVELENTDYFKEVSWTITYKPEKGVWESYMSFLPNYYISHTDYFQTGYNNTEKGLWSHLLTNRSKQVFNGKLHPWTIEFPTKNEYRNKSLEAVSFYTESKRYQNDYDFAIDDRITFNKAVIYSDRENSHLLNLTVNNGTLQQLSNYPKTNGNKSQDVLITQDNNRWNLTGIWNRVKSNRNNQVIWNWDENQINKTLNPQAVSFYGKPVLEHLTSDLFIIRLTQDKTSQYDQELRFAEIKTEQII